MQTQLFFGRGPCMVPWRYVKNETVWLLLLSWNVVNCLAEAAKFQFQRQSFSSNASVGITNTCSPGCVSNVRFETNEAHTSVVGWVKWWDDVLVRRMNQFAQRVIRLWFPSAESWAAMNGISYCQGLGFQRVVGCCLPYKADWSRLFQPSALVNCCGPSKRAIIQVETTFECAGIWIHAMKVECTSWY